jgi:hypothetical protein
MEQTITLPELKEEELRAYFQEHGDTYVGTTGLSYYCPIAWFYKDRHGIDVAVDSFMIRQQKQTRGVDHAPWSASFVSGIDREYPDQYVTGNEALVILERSVALAKAREEIWNS